MTQEQTVMYYKEWMLKGSVTIKGMSYKRYVNDHSAILAMMPTDKKMVGEICHLSSELTLTNTDLDPTYHKGFTIGNGKTLYWNLVWHKTGNCSVYSRHGSSPRYIKGDAIITVHFV